MAPGHFKLPHSTDYFSNSEKPRAINNIEKIDNRVYALSLQVHSMKDELNKAWLYVMGMGAANFVLTMYLIWSLKP